MNRIPSRPGPEGVGVSVTEFPRSGSPVNNSISNSRDNPDNLRLLIKRRQKKINHKDFMTRWHVDPRGDIESPFYRATDPGLCTGDLYLCHNPGKKLVKTWIRMSGELPRWEIAREGMRHPNPCLTDHFLVIHEDLTPAWVKRGTVLKYNRRWITAIHCSKEAVMLDP